MVCRISSKRMEPAEQRRRRSCGPVSTALGEGQQRGRIPPPSRQEPGIMLTVELSWKISSKATTPASKFQGHKLLWSSLTWSR